MTLTLEVFGRWADDTIPWDGYGIGTCPLCLRAHRLERPVDGQTVSGLCHRPAVEGRGCPVRPTDTVCDSCRYRTSRPSRGTRPVLAYFYVWRASSASMLIGRPPIVLGTLCGSCT